ncbi:hypothetical protein [Burkholderia glumae]|uniref:hypothetical protein n=1 Tax=Burkholderia glumae TaxID=337 RepID=UPI002151CE30|nr:hypothetical protein [Burkholderia glumae]
MNSSVFEKREIAGAFSRQYSGPSACPDRVRVIVGKAVNLWFLLSGPWRIGPILPSGAAAASVSVSMRPARGVGSVSRPFERYEDLFLLEFG